MQNTISVGISFPKKVIEQIDIDRKDIPRSRYLLKMLQGLYSKSNIITNPLDTTLAKAISSESVR